MSDTPEPLKWRPINTAPEDQWIIGLNKFGWVYRVHAVRNVAEDFDGWYDKIGQRHYPISWIPAPQDDT